MAKLSTRSHSEASTASISTASPSSVSSRRRATPARSTARFHVRVGGEVLRRCAQIGDRGAHPRRERLQQRQALLLAIEQPGHVLQREHHAGDGALARHRGGLHLEQPSRRRRGDEARERRSAAQFLAHVRQLLAVHQAEQRPAEPEQGLRALEQLPRALVVEQDAALGVAHQHALGELGHERRQPVALLLEPGARLARARFGVAAQAAAVGGEALDGGGELGHLARALGRGPQILVRAEQHVDLLGKPARRGHVLREQPAHGEEAQRQQQRRHGNQQRRALPEQRRPPVLRHEGGDERERDQERSGVEREHPRRELHGLAASSPSIFATSS
jgi:hypothetical protein